MSKKKQKKKQLYGPDWPKFCILGDILVKILLESLKISHFFKDKLEYFHPCTTWEGDDYFTCAQHWEGDDYI